jgi:hypothetical protein
MKKGLLSILASALLVVGCQDYDDQFSALETQINALASTVAGLSQVQSDLASLAGTVGSLASTVNGLGDQIDTAVSDGLSDIQADIDAINTAVADVASSEEVETLQAAIDASQDDLTDLLAASSVFTGDVVVNSVNTLDAYLAMGAALNIVNGNVTITVSTAMDQTKVQTLVDNILTVVNDFTYTSAASTIAETTFNNLTGVQSLTITQGGGMRFPNLVSATKVRLNDDFESTVAVIHFGSLTSVTSFQTDAVANTIEFTKATELHLTSLLYYPGGVLTLETDEGAAMPFVLDDIDADGDTLTAGLTLTITGPASFASSQIADGTLDFTDVKSVNLTDFKGDVTIGGDVESFTSNSLVSLTVDALTKVETVDVTGVVDPDATTAATKLGPAISLTSLGDLETVTIAGIASSVDLSTNNNLTSATISADVSGNIKVDGNSDLTTLTTTGATAYALDVNNNADLVALTVDLTWGNSGTGTTVDGDLDVTDNLSLESLTVSSNNLENLEVTGNTSLAKVDFTGVEAIGATGTAVVNVYNNDLTATKLTDTTDGTTDVADGGAGDKGSVASTSGMSTMAKYLTAVDADADSVAKVYWDKVESFLDTEGATDAEQTDVSSGYATSAKDQSTILLLTAGSGDGVAAGTAIKATRAFIVDLGATGSFGAQIDALTGGVNSSDLFSNGTLATTAGSATINANSSFMLATLQNAATVARFNAYGLTIASTFVANSSRTVSLVLYSSNTGSQTVSGERYVAGDAAIVANVGGNFTAVASATNYGFGVDDTVTFAVGGNTITVSPGVGGATTLAGIADDVVAAWAAKYGRSGTASASAVATMTASAGVITVTPLDAGTAGNSLAAITMSYGTGTVTATNAKNMDYLIGSATNQTDNGLGATDILVTLTHNGVGADVTSQVSFTGSAAAAMPLEEVTSVRSNSASADAADPYTLAQQCGDAVAAEGASAAIAETTAAVSFSRVGWWD